MQKAALAILFFMFIQPLHGQQSGGVFIQILGIAQDGGYPHAGCLKKCCSDAWQNDSLKKYVVSLALVDSLEKKWWLFEATPDIKYQIQYFYSLSNGQYPYLPEAVFITHAHIGHYSGLMQFGREVMSTAELPVYVFPQMKSFLETNGPWSQLVNLKNIRLHQLKEDSILFLTDNIQIAAFRVPHREEYSETAGYKIITTCKKYLFIPDIDKWEKWNRSIVTEVKAVDVAFLDGTFYEDTELKGKKMTEVPHPFIPETTKLFIAENNEVRSRICFIHFNHTNKLLWNKTSREAFLQIGFRLAVQGQVY